MVFLFFFKSRRRYTRWTGDWSSDVCSSDLSATGMTCSSSAGRSEPTQQSVADRPADEEQVMPVADEPVSEAGGHRRNAQQLLDRAPGGLGGGVGDGHGRTAYEQATPMTPNWVCSCAAIRPRVCTRQFLALASPAKGS